MTAKEYEKEIYLKGIKILEDVFKQNNINKEVNCFVLGGVYVEAVNRFQEWKQIDEDKQLINVKIPDTDINIDVYIIQKYFEEIGVGKFIQLFN